MEKSILFLVFGLSLSLAVNNDTWAFLIVISIVFAIRVLFIYKKVDSYVRYSAPLLIGALIGSLLG